MTGPGFGGAGAASYRACVRGAQPPRAASACNLAGTCGVGDAEHDPPPEARHVWPNMHHSCTQCALRSSPRTSPSSTDPIPPPRRSVWHVLLASYESMRRFGPELAGSCDLLVCDEGHRLKSAGGNKTIEGLLALGCERRVVLTGTPVQNNLEVGLGPWGAFAGRRKRPQIVLLRLQDCRARAVLARPRTAQASLLAGAVPGPRERGERTRLAAPKRSPNPLRSSTRFCPLPPPACWARWRFSSACTPTPSRGRRWGAGAPLRRCHCPCKKRKGAFSPRAAGKLQLLQRPRFPVRCQTIGKPAPHNPPTLPPPPSQTKEATPADRELGTARAT